jgi:hypothetical protein
MSDLDAKLAEVARQYDEIQADLSLPETSTDPAAIRRLGQELSRLEPVVEAFRRLEATRAELTGARELRDASDADDEMRAMARDEIDRLEADLWNARADAKQAAAQAATPLEAAQAPSPSAPVPTPEPAPAPRERRAPTVEPSQVLALTLSERIAQGRPAPTEPAA